VTLVAVAPRIFRIDSTLGSRRLAQWLVVGERRTLLVDSGIAGTVTSQVAPALAELGLAAERLTEVVITHADVDHYGGNAEVRELFPAATLRAHAADRPLIESWERIAAERYGWYRTQGLDYDADTWAWLEQAAGPDVALDGELSEGDRLDLGGIELDVLHLPGHSMGHLGLLEPASETAIVSDAVMGRGFVDLSDRLVAPPPYVDLAGYRQTIERLEEIAPKRLGTAHFPLFEGEAVADFLALSRRLTDEVDAAITAASDRATAVAALLPEVSNALGGYPQMEVELARSIGAHLDAGASA
jgi:glyoxylase-like metal-dependent hydrolase (beta-lactamase superfamily II)